MWYSPDKYKIDLLDINKELYQLEGTLDDREAKITLARFLRHNLGIATFLLSGINLAPYEEITLKAFFNRNFNLCVWGRGLGKTFIAAIYAFLQCIFEPNTNVLIAGPTFRTARFIFEKIEQLTDAPEGKLLAQCFGTKIRRNDLFEWKINGGSIKAIPLNGEKIRGFRASVLILDEFLLLPEEIVKGVLMPFLVAPQNVGERIRIRKIEDNLIKKGLMKDEERIQFKSNIRMIALSSASYTFEYLYQVYQDWLNKIQSEAGKEYNPTENVEETIRDAKYFVSQLGYEAIPKELIEQTLMEEVQSSNVSDAIIDREYRALFTDGSASYFSAKKMHDCTYKIGVDPHVRMVGERDKKYILSIDPSFSSSPTADNFAMSLFELDELEQRSVLVHNYAKAGVELKYHIQYFDFIVSHFNVVMIIADNADGNFIQSANESKIFKDKHIYYDFFEFESDLEGKEYEEQLRLAKKQYNLEGKRICFKQVFNVNFIRRANELLQTHIDKQRIHFASGINGNDIAFEKYLHEDLNLEPIGENSLIDFIDTLDSNIHHTKKECSLVEVRTNPQGNQTFDLPVHLKKSPSPNRPRKDRYTALLLGNWATRCYFDLINYRSADVRSTFVPFMVG